MVQTDLAPSSPLWRGRPRHSRPRTYPSSSTRVLSVGTSSSCLSLLVSPSPPLLSFPCSLRCQSLFRHPRARFARTLRFLNHLLVRASATFVVLAAKIRRPWPGCGTSSRKEAFYMDRSQTLTVWAFFATEGGANKVKRGLKNVTLSVECGPLTVDAPLSRDPRPHDAVQEPPSLPLFLSCEVSSCATYLATGATRSRY